MNAGPFTPLLARFNQTWAEHAPDLAVQLAGDDPHFGGVTPAAWRDLALCSGRAAPSRFSAALTPSGAPSRQLASLSTRPSLPSTLGCFTASAARARRWLRAAVLRTGKLAEAIIAISPGGYYRWRCPRPSVFARPRKARPPPKPSRRCGPAQLASTSLALRVPRPLRRPRCGRRPRRCRAVIALLDSSNSKPPSTPSFKCESGFGTTSAKLDRIRDHPRPPAPPGPAFSRARARMDRRGSEPRGAPARASVAATPPPIQAQDRPTPAAWLPSPGQTGSPWYKHGQRAAAETFLQERTRPPQPIFLAKHHRRPNRWCRGTLLRRRPSQPRAQPGPAGSL